MSGLRTTPKPSSSMDQPIMYSLRPPHVFTGRDKTGQSFASGRATQEQRSGAVAKQRGRDEVLDGVVGVAAIDGAQLDNEEQHIALGQRLCHPSRARKAAHTACAAKTKNGQALDRWREDPGDWPGSRRDLGRQAPWWTPSRWLRCHLRSMPARSMHSRLTRSSRSAADCWNTRLRAAQPCDSKCHSRGTHE